MKHDPADLAFHLGNMHVYRNGVLAGSNKGSGIAPVYRSNLWIARSAWGNDQYANMDLANFHTWGRALAPDEVAYDMCHQRDQTQCLGLMLDLQVVDYSLKDVSHNGWGLSYSGAYFANSLVRQRLPGQRAFKFDGSNDLVQMQSREIGGAFGLCVWVNIADLRNWGRIIDFGNGPGADNILLSNLATSPSLNFEVYRGDQTRALRITNFFSPAISNTAFTHICVGVDDAGVMRAWRDGVLMGQSTGWTPRSLVRTYHYVGKSNWAGDALFSGYMSDLKIFSHGLDQSTVEATMCRGQATIDCIGLMGRWTFDQRTTTDVSGSGWHGNMIFRNQDAASLFTPRGPKGYALSLTGKDTYMTMTSRPMGGPMSFCFWTNHYSFPAYSRVFDFGCGNGGKKMMRRTARNALKKSPTSVKHHFI